MLASNGAWVYISGLSLCECMAGVYIYIYNFDILNARVGVSCQSLSCIGVACQSLSCVGVAWHSLTCIGVACQSLSCVGVACQSLSCAAPMRINGSALTGADRL